LLILDNGKEEIELKEVMILTGAGQIGMAIARRVGLVKKLSLVIRILRMQTMYQKL